MKWLVVTSAVPIATLWNEKWLQITLAVRLCMLVDPAVSLNSEVEFFKTRFDIPKLRPSGRLSGFDICNFWKGLKNLKFETISTIFFRLFCLTSMSVRRGNGSHPKHHELSPIASVHDYFSHAGVGVNSDITRIERTPSAPSSEVFKHFFEIFLMIFRQLRENMTAQYVLKNKFLEFWLVDMFSAHLAARGS